MNRARRVEAMRDIDDSRVRVAAHVVGLLLESGELLSENDVEPLAVITFGAKDAELLTAVREALSGGRGAPD